MLDFYTWTTPNGRKVSILLEELGMPYRVQPIDIGRDQQFSPEFLAISPNNRIPAIVHEADGKRVALMESGAIMVYLADLHGRFLPTDTRRYDVLQWLMWQMGGFGPMLGQAHHFLRYQRGKAEYAEQRYAAEAKRLYGVLDRRLANNEFVAAGEYSIADMAIWPWASRFEWHEVDLHAFPHVLRWYRTLAARPAVQRGYDCPQVVGPIPVP